jgi:chemotaxis protein CheZ
MSRAPLFDHTHAPDLSKALPAYERSGGKKAASGDPLLTQRRIAPLYPTLSRLASYGAMPASLEELVRAAVRAELDDLRRFVDRRIAELSMEIQATVQLVDYSETNLSAKLASIHEQISNVVAPPAAATYNGGIELEAVVQATETAANQIMEAAEAISEWLRMGGDPTGLPEVTQQVNAIFEACTFQDLTGQRIRRAIEHLQQVETMLSGMVEEETSEQHAAPAPDLAQTDIDNMFA